MALLPYHQQAQQQDAEREEDARRRALTLYKRKVVLLSIGLCTASIAFVVLAYLHCTGHHRHHEGAVRAQHPRMHTPHTNA